MIETPLDRAMAAMSSGAEDDAARMAFYSRLIDAELFLLLQSEPVDGAIEPQVFDLSDGRFVLVFDTEERLAAFAGGIQPYVAITGRTLAKMLVKQGLGFGLNVDVAPSTFFVPADGVSWLAGTVFEEPDAREARVIEVFSPHNVTEAFLVALDAKLGVAEGLARFAYLVDAKYEDGSEGRLLGFVDALDGVQHALAKSVNEALVFSGEEGGLDVAFFSGADSVVAHLASCGIRLDLPAVQEAPAKGQDKDRPPRLR